VRSEPPVEAIILDVGGVVIRIDERRTAEALAAGSDKSVDFYADAVRYESELMAQMYTGRASVDDVLADHTQRHGWRLGREAFADAWLAMLDGPIEPTADAVARLGEDVGLYILSNTMDVHLAALRADPVVARADRFFASCEMGLAKPDPAIYRAVLAEIDLPAERTAMFDDNAANIAAAKSLGIRAVLVTDEQTVARTLGQWGLIAPPPKTP
jgi:putative hydrolase of the HAD superfamily